MDFIVCLKPYPLVIKRSGQAIKNSNKDGCLARILCFGEAAQREKSLILSNNFKILRDGTCEQCPDYQYAKDEDDNKESSALDSLGLRP